MTGIRHLTDPNELQKFHELLTKDRPWYSPWYFLLTKLDKDPELSRGSWKDSKAKLTIVEAMEWMRKGHNIGIAATTMDGLCIIDIDDIDVTPDEAMKETLTIRSRKRIGRHYFYWTEDPKCKVVLPTDTAGEIRASWAYVVAPGSFVPCNDKERALIPPDQLEFEGKYSIEHERDVADITWKEVPKVFQEQAAKEKKAKAEKRKRKTKKTAPGNNTKPDSKIFNLDWSDLQSIPDENRFPSLFHDSETGKNTSIEDRILTCWRHNVSHTPLSGLCVLAGITDCQSAGEGIDGSGVGPTELDYKCGETLYKAWRYALDQGIIPKDDPMPAPAVKWCGIQADCGVAVEKMVPPKIGEQEEEFKPSLLESFLVVNDRGKLTFSPIKCAEWFFRNSGMYFITFKDTDEVFFYKDGIYVPNGDKQIGGITQKISDGFMLTTHTINEIINHIRRWTYIDRDVVDNRPYVLNLKNLLYDIETSTPMPHTPEYISLNQIPVRYDVDARCERFERFVEEIMPNDDDRRTIQEMFGHTLIKDYDIQKWFMCHGGGANGKTTLLNTLNAMLGQKNVSAIKLQALEETFSASHLFGKMANINADLSYEDVRHVGMLLQLTGGDAITAQFKSMPLFDFVNHATLIYSANVLPAFGVDTHAMRRRLIYLSFDQTFLTTDIDRKLGKKLTTPEALSGILNYALAGAKNLVDNQEIFYRFGDEEVMKRYIRMSDSVTTFINDCIEFTGNDEDVINKTDLYKVYKRWWVNTSQRSRMVSSNVFTNKLNNKPEMNEGRHDTGKGKVWKWIIVRYDVTGDESQSTLSDETDGFSPIVCPTHTCQNNCKITQTQVTATIGKTPSVTSEPSESKEVLLGYIKNGVYTLGYSNDLKKFTTTDLLIKYFKGHPAKIQGLTTELIAELLDANLEELKLIKIDDKTYRQKEK